MKKTRSAYIHLWHIPLPSPLPVENVLYFQHPHSHYAFVVLVLELVDLLVHGAGPVGLHKSLKVGPENLAMLGATLCSISPHFPVGLVPNYFHTIRELVFARVRGLFPYKNKKIWSQKVITNL